MTGLLPVGSALVGSTSLTWVGFLCGRPGEHPGDLEQTAPALSVPHSPLYTQDRCVSHVQSAHLAINS